MKIGVVIDYYRLRNDIRELLLKLSLTHEVVAFADEKEYPIVEDIVEKRLIPNK